MKYTPKQLHYFKRELVTNEINKEMDQLVNSTDISSLSYISNDKYEYTHEYPFLAYIFRNIITEFPLLKHTYDKEFWPKCKSLLDDFNNAQISDNYAPRYTDGSIQKRVIQHKIKNTLVFAFCASIKTIQGAEESVKVEKISPLPTLTPQRPSSIHPQLRINILSVREIRVKKTLRDTTYAEFLIETYLPNSDSPILVARRLSDFRKFRNQLRSVYKFNTLPDIAYRSNEANPNGYGEHNRLLLRSFLQQLVGTTPCTKQQQIIRKSPLLYSFLTDNPICLTPQEEEEALKREKMDSDRLMEQQKYQKELNTRVLQLQDTMEDLKKSILQPGGLIKIFETIKSTKQVVDLPESLKKVFEWARINLAFVLHKQFVTSDIATENLVNLRRTHTMMPYKTLGFFLKLSNPMSMMKGILDIFLAQPFGGRSLFQRLIISNMNEEAKVHQKDINGLEQKIQNKHFCQKLYNAVRTPQLEKSQLRDNEAGIQELLAVLDEDSIEPALTKEEKACIIDDSYPDRHKLLKRLNQLWSLYARQHEQELVMDLVFQGAASELLKEFIAIFYQPLAEVYKAADIGKTISHVSLFIDDLLKLIDQTIPSQKGKKEEEDVDKIQLFIDLVQRHEQHFYDFVHNVHSQEASRVFDELVLYVDKLFTFVFMGIPGKIDMNECIQKAGIESQKEKDQLMNEINALCEYRYQQKMYRFERTKRKLMLHQGQYPNDHMTTDGLAVISNDDLNAVNEDIFQYIPKNSEMMNALGDMEEYEYEDDELYQMKQHTDTHSCHSSIQSRTSSMSSGSHISHAGMEPPYLVIIPKVIPFFVSDVLQLMNKPK
ncbi:hypothetical protein BDB01DRAFT_901645 [Pilobolus umbonatus]|nr:hypothetical protein BDB01DRAFT_901645 [Pilobolus umbonatus]